MKKSNDSFVSSGDIKMSDPNNKAPSESSIAMSTSCFGVKNIQITNQNSDKSSEVDESQWKNQFINNLRNVFQNVDANQDGKISLDEWMASTNQIRCFIRDGALTDEDYKLYFWRIDANGDGFVTWDNLVQYLLRDISSTELHRGEQSIQFIQKTSKGIPLREHVHREMVKMIAQCESSSEYITLSSDSIRFWSAYDLQYIRSICDPGLFSSMLIFESHLKMAVTTSNRRVLLYDIDSLNQLPCEISASPSPMIIKRMTQKDAKTALKNLQTTKLTLFNSPTCMLPAKYALTSPSIIIFFVGDDQGFIQAYQITAPLRRKSPAYKIECIGKTRMHNGSITQMSLIECFNCYASSSCDKTVKFWEFNEKTKKFEELRVLKDHGEITGFKFFEKQKTVITCGISRDAYVWSISPPQRIFKLGGHCNTVIAITDYITSTNERYLMTMTNRKEFRLWDSVSYRMAREWTDPALLRPENHYSAVIYDEKRHSIITAASYPIRWSENAELLENFLEQSTHKHSIVGCHYSPAFSQIVTVDSIGNFSSYNIKNGKLQSKRETEWNPESTDLSVTTLDYAGRRLITCNYQNLFQMWNFNSGELMKVLVLDDLSSSDQIGSEIIANKNKKTEDEIDPKSLKAQMNPDLMLRINQKEMMNTEPINTSKFGYSQLMKKNTITSCLGFYKIGGREFIVKGGWDKTVYMFTEVDYGSFTLFRRYIGHKNDISSIIPYKDGVISGSVSGEIFCWALDTNNAQAGAVIESNAAVETLHCFGGTHLLVGDSLGYITVLTVPKLQFIERFKAHGLIQNHAITSIESCSKSGIILTGDTFGYVKKWKIMTAFTNHTISADSSTLSLNTNQTSNQASNQIPSLVSNQTSDSISNQTSNAASNQTSNSESNQKNLNSKKSKFNLNKSHVNFGNDILNEISRKGSVISKGSYSRKNSSSLLNFFIMEPIKIHRCHNFAILNITLVMDGQFIITSGSDMNVKMFSSDNFEYVGLFHHESLWDLNDKSTWLLNNKGVEYDSKHFTEEEKQKKKVKKKDENETKSKEYKKLDIQDTIEVNFEYGSDSDNDAEEEKEKNGLNEKSGQISTENGCVEKVDLAVDNVSTLNENQEQEANQEFSAQKTYDLIENFIDEEERRLIPYRVQIQKRSQEQNKKSVQKVKMPFLMQTSMRPNELIAKVSRCLNSSWIGNGGAIHGNSKYKPNNEQAEVRKTLRLPIMTPRHFKKNNNRPKP